MKLTSSDVAHSHTACSSTGSKNTLKNIAANFLRLWKHSRYKIGPQPLYSLAAVQRVVDLSHLWPAIYSVCNNAQGSELVPKDFWCKFWNLKFVTNNNSLVHLIHDEACAVLWSILCNFLRVDVFLASVVDLSHHWSAIFPVSNKIQSLEFISLIIFTQIARTCIKK